MATISSSASAAGSASVDTEEWWLKDPTDSTLNTTFKPTRRMLTLSDSADQAVFRPLGRSTAVVVSDVLRGAELPFEAVCSDQAALDALEALRDTQRTLLLQMGSSGEQFYVNLVGPRTRTRRTVVRSGAPAHYVYSVKAVEVDAPSQ